MINTREFLPIHSTVNVLLAEDDYGDRMLFQESLSELPVSVDLNTVANGVELINWLSANEKNLPDALFLDLKMPRKNGLAALAEIKLNPGFQDLPVFIITTAKNEEMIKRAYMDAAHYCIQKPIIFWELKSLIYKSIKLIAEEDLSLPDRDNFVLTVNKT